MSRWCGTCGLDLRSDLPPSQAPEAGQARHLEQRWLAANPHAAQGFLPPAHSTAAPADSPASGSFRDLRASALLTTRWLWLCFALAVAALGVDALWLRRETTGSWTYDEFVSLTNLMDTLALVQLVVLLIGAVIFIVWFQRGYSNLAALGRTEPRWSRGWAIFGWFVPVVSLVIPKQIANDLWRAGETEARVPGIVHWWWALFLIAGLVTNISARALTEPATMEDLRGAIVTDAVAQGLTAVSALAAIAVVGRTSRRQKDRAHALDLAAEGAR